MNIKEVLLIGVTFLNLSLGVLIYWNNKKNWTNIFFSSLAFSLSLWSFSMLMYATLANSYDNIIVWSRILYASGMSIPLFFVLFSNSFPQGVITLNRMVIFLLLFAYFALLTITLLSDWVISNLIIDGSNRILIHGILYPAYFLFFTAGMTWALLLLFNKYIYAKGTLKKQIKFMFFGTLIPTVCTGIINMVLPAMQDFYYAWTGPLFSLVMIGFISYAIIKVRLMDIKLIAVQIFATAITLFTLLEIFTSSSQMEIIVRSIIFIVTAVFSILLIRSVLREVYRREQMEKLAADLAVANKKREHINKQLQHANEQLKKLDEAKSEFISIASHQLRTPLTAIKGYGSMLLDGDFGDMKEVKQKDAVEKMVVSNNRLISLVENLLNISRIESGRLKFDFQVQQLEPLVEEVFNNMQQSAQNAGLYLKLQKPDKDLPPVRMDDEKIRQVVINFIDNAIKYTRQGGITVYLSQKGKKIICKVSDTGIGVSKEDQKRLFQKFTRGKNAFLVNTEGTGLGLYVAQMMINSHKGEIWIESKGEGKGSNFCFSLPVHKEKKRKKG